MVLCVLDARATITQSLVVGVTALKSSTVVIVVNFC